jgi:hypothetical protein
LDETYPELDISVSKDLLPRINDIIIDTFLSTRYQMNPNKRKFCFELFGYDFLIDEDFRVWLIECNTNPYMGTPNEYMMDLMPKLIDDIAKIAIDPVYPPQ